MQNGDNVTIYNNTVGTVTETFTFPTSQETIVLSNKGSKNITYTIGANTGTLTPSTYVKVIGAFSSFSLSSEQGTQAFEVWSEEAGTKGVTPEAVQSLGDQVSSFSGQLGDITTQMAESAKQTGFLVTLKMYNVKTNEEDSTFDNAAGIQTAADYAYQIGADLYLDGNYVLKTPVILKCGVKGRGKIIIDTTVTTSMITLDKSTTSESVTMSGLSGLTQGSKKIIGLTGKKGYIGVLSSTDEMIKRTGGQDAYYKKDAFRVVSADGDLSCALDNTYATGTTTLTIYPPERPLTFDNFTIEVRNVGSNGSSLLEVKHSDVVFNSLTIDNYTNNQIQYAVAVSETVNVHFYNPRINGAMYYEPSPSIGYGINIWNSAHITINDAHIYNCRHTTSGRHAKDVTVKGGVHGSSVDCHWGNDWKIRDITVHVQKTHTNPNTGTQFTNYMAFLYCGSNISVENCTVYGAKLFLALRDDTPELRGSVNLNNNKWYPEIDNDYCWFGYSIGDNTFDFTRTISEPEIIVIENNKLFAPLLNGSTPSYVKYYSNGYNRTYAKTKVREIRLRNNYHGDVVAKFLEIRKNTARVSETTVTKVVISGMETNSDKIDLQFANQETYPNIQIHDYTSGYANVDKDLYDIFMSDVRNVYMYTDATTIRKGIFDNVTFCYRIHRKNITQDASLNYLQPTDCNWKFNKCEFLYYANHNAGSETFWFRLDITNQFYTNCIFKCITSWNTDRYASGSWNSNVFYANNNIKVAGKTFTGTLNGLVNAAYATT
jgi:hypothetical protein